jgi:hypothetical protein
MRILIEGVRSDYLADEPFAGRACLYEAIQNEDLTPASNPVKRVCKGCKDL